MKSDIAKLYLFSLLRNVQFYGAISIPFFLDWAQINYMRIFILEAWFMLWIFLLEIPTGVVADKYGRKTSIAIGTVLAVMSLLIFGLINNYYAFFVAEFIGAIAATLFSGADKALVYDTLLQLKKKKDARHYLSKYEAFGTAGKFIGLPVGSIIAGSAILAYPKTLPLTFILTAVFTGLMFFVVLTIKEPKRKTLDKDWLEAGIKGFKYIFKHKKLRAFSFNTVFIAVATFFMFWFYQPLSGDAGINIVYFGFIGAGFNIFGTVLLSNLKKIERFISINNLLFYSAIIPGLFFVGVAFFRNVFFVLLAIFMITGLRLLRRPVLDDFMNQHIQSKTRATVLSGISMLERVGILILYPLVGFLADLSLTYVLVFLGLITLIFSFVTKLEADHFV